MLIGLQKKIISRRLFFDVSSATCVSILERNSINITSIAFHPTAPILATVAMTKT